MQIFVMKVLPFRSFLRDYEIPISLLELSDHVQQKLSCGRDSRLHCVHTKKMDPEFGIKMQHRTSAKSKAFIIPLFYLFILWKELH